MKPYISVGILETMWYGTITSFRILYLIVRNTDSYLDSVFRGGYGQ